MNPDLERAKQSLEEIALTAREIKDSLLPVERRIRETSIRLPKTVFLRRLYDELLTIQRIAMLKSYGDEADVARTTKMQGRVVFSFAVALYMPLTRNDFPFNIYNYNSFYGLELPMSHLSNHSHPNTPESSSLELLLNVQNQARYGKKHNQSPFVLANEYPESVVNSQTLGDLQYFYNLKVDEFVKNYLNLLTKIEKRLGDFAEFSFKSLEERVIPTKLPNIPIHIFTKGILKGAHLQEEKKIIANMMKLDNWADSLKAIQDFINDVRDPKRGNLRRYRVLLTDENFTPVTLAPPPKRGEILGLDENLMRLEALIRGYAQGMSTPNIVLVGPGGVGKTMSLRYVMEATEDVRLKHLRYFLMDSLEDVKRLAPLSKTYKPVGIIDDMRGEVNPKVYAALKQQLEGLEDTLFDRTLTIISANPELWGELDDPVKQRLGGVQLDYKPNVDSYEQLVRLFCDKFDVGYKPKIVEQVKDMVPRQVRDYIRALGSEQAGLRNKK